VRGRKKSILFQISPFRIEKNIQERVRALSFFFPGRYDAVIRWRAIRSEVVFQFPDLAERKTNADIPVVTPFVIVKFGELFWLLRLLVVRADKQGITLHQDI
jgi:hypothetical protein